MIILLLCQTMISHAIILVYFRFVQRFAVNAAMGISSRIHLLEIADDDRRESILKNKETVMQLEAVSRKVKLYLVNVVANISQPLYILKIFFFISIYLSFKQILFLTSVYLNIL